MPSFADTMKGGVSYDYDNSINVEEIQNKLPKIEKDFIDLNYSINFKPLNMLSEDEMVIKKTPASPKIKGGSSYIPDNYEISLSTGKAQGNYKAAEKAYLSIKDNYPQSPEASEIDKYIAHVRAIK